MQTHAKCSIEVATEIWNSRDSRYKNRESIQEQLTKASEDK
jgi:hypothetical protein